MTLKTIKKYIIIFIKKRKINNFNNILLTYLIEIILLNGT